MLITIQPTKLKTTDKGTLDLKHFLTELETNQIKEREHYKTSYSSPPVKK